MCIQSSYRQIGIFPSTDPASGYQSRLDVNSRLGRCTVRRKCIENITRCSERTCGGCGAGFAERRVGFSTHLAQCNIARGTSAGVQRELAID